MKNELKIGHDKEVFTKKRQNMQIVTGIGVVLIVIGFAISNPLLIAIGFIVSLVAGFFLFQDFRTNNVPCLILNEKGIVDEIEWVGYGLIEWKDILNVRIDNNFKHLILIDVSNEEKYLNKMRVNKRFGSSYKWQLKNDSFNYGTVVFLNIKTLEKNRDTIFDMIQNRLENYIADYKA